MIKDLYNLHYDLGILSNTFVLLCTYTAYLRYKKLDKQTTLST